MRTLAGPLQRLDVLAFSPDGTELVGYGTYDPTLGLSSSPVADRGVLVWQLGGGPDTPRHLFSDRTARSICYSADGHWLFVTLDQRPAESAAPLGLFAVPRPSLAAPDQPLSDARLCAFASGRLLAAGYAPFGNLGWTGTLSCHRVAAAATFPVVWAVSYQVLHRTPVAVAAAPDGRAVVTDDQHNPFGTDQYLLSVRAAKTGQVLSTVESPARKSASLSVSPDGETLVLNAGTSLFVWPLADLSAAPRKVTFGKKHCTGVAFLPDGRTLLASGNDGTVRRLDLGTGKALATYSWKAGKARSVAVSPDGLVAAVGTNKGQVILFDLD